MKTLLLLVIAVAGCTDPVPPESRELCSQRPIGDTRDAIDLVIVARDAKGQIHDVTDRAPTSIVLSDGRTGLALGIRARNLDGCAIGVVMRSPDRDELRGGTMVQLDLEGRPDPDDALQFVELPSATPNDTIDVVIQDATGRWAASTYVP